MQSFIAAFDGSMEALKGSLRQAFVPMKSFLDIFLNPVYGVVLSALIFIILMVFSIKKTGNDFSKKIKSPKVLAVCAMLIAINVILELFAQDVTAFIRLSFSFVTMPVAAMAFGPVIACILGMLQDIIGLIIRPTGAWLFVLTMNAGIAGMIAGLILYKKEVRLWRVLLSELLIVLVVNVLLNSAGLAPTIGSGLAGILPSRIIKNLLLLPLQVAIVYGILKVIKKRVKLL